MIHYAPNISWLFPELPFAERPRAAVEAGFDAVEFGFYGQADLDAVEAEQQASGLEVVLFNMDVPGWGEQNLGYLADPELRDTFQKALDSSLLIADRLKAHKIMLPVGAVRPALSHEVQTACIIENLCSAALLAEHAGVMLTLEVLNPADVPNYFLVSSKLAVDIVRAVNHPQVRFQYDAYHLQSLEGHLIQTLVQNIDAIGHIQLGDAPGRTEPGFGELNVTNIVTAAEDAGYTGYIGLEYIPQNPGAAALNWVPDARRGGRQRAENR